MIALQQVEETQRQAVPDEWAAGAAVARCATQPATCLASSRRQFSESSRPGPVKENRRRCSRSPQDPRRRHAYRIQWCRPRGRTRIPGAAPSFPA